MCKNLIRKNRIERWIYLQQLKKDLAGRPKYQVVFK